MTAILNIYSYHCNFLIYWPILKKNGLLSTLNKEFIDLRKIICLIKRVFDFSKISTGMHFIPLQSMVCVSYHCRMK